MAIMTHAKFHFNRLMLTLIFGIWASEPPTPPGPSERLKRPGLIGLIIRSTSRTIFLAFGGNMVAITANKQKQNTLGILTVESNEVS